MVAPSSSLVNGAGQGYAVSVLERAKTLNHEEMLGAVP
jgi:hypothetical protein